MSQNNDALFQKNLIPLLGMLKTSTGVDFQHYKMSTVQRRVIRRMTLNKMSQLSEYFAFVKSNANELVCLYHDLLINVTSFFREPQTFQALKKIIQNRLKLSPSFFSDKIRIWIPGCSTGEEVYSIAILFLECLEEIGSQKTIHIFATDIDDVAIQKARSGFYNASEHMGVSPERLAKYFTLEGARYRINKSVRQLCSFSIHDLSRHPPFSHLDLISCRNLLIYFDGDLQKRVMPIFHYALNPGGLLTLGYSEAIGGFLEAFKPEDQKNKIYTKLNTTILLPAAYALKEPRIKSVGFHHQEGGRMDKSHDKEGLLIKEVDRLLLEQFAPAGVLINEQMEVLQFRGDTGHFLLPSPGRASLNLFSMARDGLLSHIQEGISHVQKAGTPFEKGGIRLIYEGFVITLSLNISMVISPIANRKNYLILFQEKTPAHSNQSHRKNFLKRLVQYFKPLKPEITPLPETNPLKEELRATKLYLQTIIENQDYTNEELQSANEEILSSNEELQSTNEELETAKEELQSSNEELTTVNEELLKQNGELDRAIFDLNNIFSSSNLALIIVGQDLKIRWFTQVAKMILNHISSDIGRPLDDLKISVPSLDMKALILGVMESDIIKEQDVQDQHGNWYKMRILPYKTAHNLIEGVLIIFINIDSSKLNHT